MSRAAGVKTVVVTGASGKIGRVLTRRLVASGGYRVVAVGRDEARLQRALQSPARVGGRLAIRTCDLTSEEDIARLLADLRDQVGGVAALCHLAATRSAHPLAEHPLEDFRVALATSLTSAFLLMRGLLPAMAEAGWGRVINVAGSSAHSGAPGRAGMLAAKAGLVGLSKSAALEYAPTGVTVNVVSPGLIADVAQDAGEAPNPVGRHGTPDEVAACCDYLLSDAAGYVTGQTLLVNGGAYLP